MGPRKIRTIRAWLGLTQEQLAEQIGVRQNTVARWEAGERKPGGPATKLLEQLWKQVQGESAAA